MAGTNEVSRQKECAGNFTLPQNREGILIIVQISVVKGDEDVRPADALLSLRHGNRLIQRDNWKSLLQPADLLIE